MAYYLITDNKQRAFFICIKKVKNILFGWTKAILASYWSLLLWMVWQTSALVVWPKKAPWSYSWGWEWQWEPWVDRKQLQSFKEI